MSRLYWVGALLMFGTLASVAGTTAAYTALYLRSAF